MGCASSVPVAKQILPPEINKSHLSVERVIGQGGFGKVNAVVKRKGFDRDQWYAMKTLTKAIILEKNHVSMVMKERNLLARLHCPQLVNMHYAFQDERNLYIVMDLCLGGDLHFQLTQLPSRRFPEHQARFYVASIILCLEYMHSAGVMHRDIKPENLLLDEMGQLKVTDLGVSAETVDGVCRSTSGTRPYMAPEVFISGHAHTYSADYYSLGITTYQLLLGQRPYKPDTSNMKSIVRMSTFVAPDKYTDLTLIRRILINAQDRKATSNDLRYALQLGPYVSPEALDFVQHCLICNPKYRLGSEGAKEVKAHPWFDGIDWDAMAHQNAPAPFIPDSQRANCSVNEADVVSLLLEDAPDNAPQIDASDQAKFSGYDYRTNATDNLSGRTERVLISRTPLKQNYTGSLDLDDSLRQMTVTRVQSVELLSSNSLSAASGNSRKVGVDSGGNGSGELKTGAGVGGNVLKGVSPGVFQPSPRGLAQSHVFGSDLLLQQHAPPITSPLEQPVRRIDAVHHNANCAHPGLLVPLSPIPPVLAPREPPGSTQDLQGNWRINDGLLVNAHDGFAGHGQGIREPAIQRGASPQAIGRPNLRSETPYASLESAGTSPTGESRYRIEAPLSGTTPAVVDVSDMGRSVSHLPPAETKDPY